MLEHHSQREELDWLRQVRSRYERVVRHIVARYERDSMDAEELVADVFVLTYKNRVTLCRAPDTRLRNWIIQTARFVSVNHVRKALNRKRLRELVERESARVVPGPEEELVASADLAEAAARSEMIERALLALRPDYRQALVMNSLGHTSDQIGAILGISANAARKRLMRARSELRNAYAEITGGNVGSV